jgi:hypothetical protein
MSPPEQPEVQAVKLWPNPGVLFRDSLLDAAAWRERMLRDPVWRGMYEALPELSDQFPDVSAKEIRDAEERAAQLLQAAYFSAEYDGRGCAYLKLTFPGFCDETYSMVYAYGCWQAR